MFILLPVLAAALWLAASVALVLDISGHFHHHPRPVRERGRVQ